MVTNHLHTMPPKTKPKTKVKAISITFRPRTGITDMALDKIRAYCIPLCEYYHFITEKENSARHLHATLFLIQEDAVAYFNRDIKKKLLKPLLKSIDDGSILKRAYVGKSVYNADWLNHYCAKDDATKIIDTYLPADRAKLEPYYKDTVKKAFHDYVHFDFENAYKEKYPDRLDPSIDDINRFLCYQMYDARTRRVIQEPRKVKNLIYSLHSYMTKARTFYFHSNVELHDQILHLTGLRYSCTVCGYNNSSTVPSICNHID